MKVIEKITLHIHKYILVYYTLLHHFLFCFFRLDSSKSYAEVATPPAKNRQQQQQNYSQQQPQRLSPFDELMAQHQQQLQRERQLLRLASARGQQQQQRSTSAAGPSSGATISEATAAEVAAATTSGSGSGKLSTIPPPIPIKTSKLEDIMPHLAEPPFEYSTPARFTELPKKSLSETTADVKRGLLSSILEKVRSKEEIQQQQQNSVEAAKSGGGSQPQTSTTTTKQRLMAPLASTESLSVSDASSKRLSTSVDSTASSKCTNY